MEGPLFSEPPDVTKRTGGPVEQFPLELDKETGPTTTTIKTKVEGEIDISSINLSNCGVNSVVSLLTSSSSPPPPTKSIFEDQNQNRLKGSLVIDIPNTNQNHHHVTNLTSNPNPVTTTMTRAMSNHGQLGVADPVQLDSIYESNLKFFPSSPKDLDFMKNVRKVYISRLDESPCGYKITDETGEGVFETVEGESGGSFWSKYFSQQQRLLYMKDKYQHGILKFEFGRSRTVSCCQTLRFAAMTSHFQSKSEEPLCIIFKDRGCCIYSCCSSDVTYESVPQMDNIHPFTVRTKRQWKNRAEFMVKHSDGSILAFIDKEKKFYTLTMGENLKPPMKSCLIGFVVTMDIMDREDTGRLNCYLRPSTYVTLLFLLMLFLMIGAFLFHFITAMVLAWPDKSDRLGCSDGVHVHHDPDSATTNFNHTSETFPALLRNTTYSANQITI